MPMQNGIQQYVKLEARLVLLAWLNDLFGYPHNRDLLADVKEAAEGFDSTGRSFIYYHLLARGDKVKIPPADLARYDDDVHAHLQAMNARRPEPLTLRYFQYLAALYTEVFLDHYFHRRADMLRSLNGFVAARNAKRLAGEPQDAEFSASDLKKLAFWMATGSGKTLIMHLNYRQFLHYNDQPLDNVLLITPNEGLSDQHLAELAASGIPARRFDLHESGLGLAAKDAVRVIEITKLVEEKRGGGVSVPVEVLWIVAGEKQHIVFIEPHGMLHEKAYQYDDKAQLHERLPGLAQEISTRSGRRHVTLDSYIISATPYDDLRKRYGDGSWDRDRFAAAHILFLERTSEYDYMERMFTEQRK